MRMRRSGKAERIITKARGITVFCLDHGFVGQKVEPENGNACAKQMLGLYELIKRSYLTVNNNGSYTLMIHSNLWYDFTSYVGGK